MLAVVEKPESRLRSIILKAMCEQDRKAALTLGEIYEYTQQAEEITKELFLEELERLKGEGIVQQVDINPSRTLNMLPVPDSEPMYCLTLKGYCEFFKTKQGE